MSSGKCPAAQIAQKMAMSGARNLVPDDYGSATPVMGKLRKDILERIRPVMVMSSSLVRFRPSQAEMDLIETANDRIDAMMGSAPGASTSRTTIKGKGTALPRKKLADPKTPEVTKTLSKVEKAAASGDLSAAL
jgi:hypothetical protein